MSGWGHKGGGGGGGGGGTLYARVFCPWGTIKPRLYCPGDIIP